MKVSNINGWMTEPDLEWLYETSKKMNSVVEIGSWMGRSTFSLCSGCKGIVYAVDHFLGSKEHQEQIKLMNLNIFEEFTKNMSGFNNLKVLKMTSAEASKSLLVPSLVDMIFIDGSHDYTSAITDFKLWYHRTKILFCGHDNDEDGVPIALKEFFGEELGTVVEDGSIWAVWL